MQGTIAPEGRTATADIQSMAHAIRFLALDSILKAGEGHQGVPLGMAEIAATLYARHVTLDPKDPLWPTATAWRSQTATARCCSTRS